MSESDHEWCRDVRRDEAVRAAEDAAAVPSIQHRDLPEAVAALRERVARLEAATPPRGWLTAEERKAVDAARDYFDDDNHGDSECVFIARMLKQLLARSSPPRVKVPTWMHDDVRRCVIAAIRAAGVEVE